MNDFSNAEPSGVDLSGRRLGDLLLLRRLGAGAMAEVYLAEQSSLKRKVAVKVLKSERAADYTYVRRFHREAQAAARLVHANVVQIYEVGQVDGIHFIVQEYVKGLNVRQWIAKEGPFEVSLAVSVMRQTAAALVVAEEHQIVHRDIKPENILVARTGEVKVADFGLARLIIEGEAADLTQAGVTMGTPLYMSPEQFEGRKLDSRSDIYSLGVTCYHMLVGVPPFSGNTGLSVAVQHLRKTPKSLGSSRKDLPPKLCQIVHRMLEKSPSNRYGSPSELLEDLRRIQASVGSGVGMQFIPTTDTANDSPTGTFHSQAPVAISTSRGSNWGTHLILLTTILVAFLLGGSLALMVGVEPPLLVDAEPTPTMIVKRETGLRQWYFASQANMPEAWQSVIDYFPEERDLADQARQQLARIYIDRRDDGLAITVLDQLNKSSDREELRAFGVAGKAILFALQGKTVESCRALRILWPIRDSLKDEQMRRMLAYVLRRDKDSLGQPEFDQWQRWLARLPTEDD